MNCCDEYIDLGCYDSCETIVLPYQTDETGVHTIIIKSNGHYKSYKVTLTAGDNFSIDLSKFRENDVSVFQIKLPSGSFFSTTIDNVEYFCFKVDISVRGGDEEEDVVFSLGDFNNDFNNDFLI